MDAALRKSIQELGNVAEDFKDVQTQVANLKGAVPADLQEKLARIDSAVSAADAAKTAADTVLQEKQADAKRISDLEAKNAEFETALDEMALKGARTVNGETVSADELAQKQAFVDFVTKGVRTKDNSGIVNAEGGYVVPETLDMAIIRSQRDATIMRSICSQMNTSNPNIKLPASTGAAGVQVVAEKAPRDTTSTPTFALLEPKVVTMQASPRATEEFLNDAMIDVEGWLTDEVAISFAEYENMMFTKGDGTSDTLGILGAPTSAVTDKAGTRPIGTLQELTSSSAGAIASDDLIKLIHSTKPAYRQNARFMMSGLTLSAIRQMKDGDNNYLWKPGLVEGQASTLLGFSVAENEDMPEIADGAGADVIAFGDFVRGYRIVDVVGTTLLRNPYITPGFVTFYMTKRTGGVVRDSLALKLLAIQ